MKEIFKKDDNDQKEEKGPTEAVSFLSLVCFIFFSIKKKQTKTISSFVSQMKAMLYT
jgi:hypothetical protein